MSTTPDPIDLAVGARIRARRKIVGLSQTALADAVGFTCQQIAKYECGKNRVSVSVLVRIAARLGVAPAELLGESVPSQRNVSFSPPRRQRRDGADLRLCRAS